MESMFIVKKVATVSGYASVEAAITGMAVGDLIAVGDGKLLFGANSIIGDFAKVQDIKFITKVGGTPAPSNIKVSVSIPRLSIFRYNYQTPVAGVNQKVRLGGITGTDSLVIPTDGVVDLVFRNLSYNHIIASQRISVNMTKKAAQTVEAFVDALVAEINKQSAFLATPFFTAVKVGTAPNFGIDFTMANTNVDFDIAIEGFLEGSVQTEITKAVSPIGAGADVLRMEKDISRFTGNQGYAELGDLWYKQPFEASASLSYRVSTLSWEGIAPTPTNSIKVANNNCIIATDSAVDNGTITVDAFLKLVANVAETNVIESDENATDGTEN